MNDTTCRSIGRALGVGILLAAAPWAGAQPPAAGPATPGAPAGPPAAAPAKLTNEQVSYLFGLMFGEQLHSIGLTTEVISEAVDRGIKDGLLGKKPAPAERQQVQEFFRSEMVAFSARNKTAAEEFLAHNGKEKGVQTTPSGLQYKVISPGDAKAAAIELSDEVSVNYRGKLLDGSEFDSSYARGAPATFPVGGVIRGWQEALVLMKPGAKWQLFVPPELAYGANPRPGIPGNSLLIFDVELLGVKSKPSAPDAKPGAAPKSPPTSPH